MLVTAIAEYQKNRYRVSLDTGESFVLYRGELGKMNIRENAVLPDAVYREIMESVLPKRAKLRGLNLLKSRAYTEYQLRKKYTEGGYPVSIIDEAISYLKELKLIDDYSYARNHIDYYGATRSRKRLQQDLYSKGISKDIINAAIEEANREDSIREEDIIVRLLEKKHYNPDSATYEDRQKIMRYLYGKGFDMDIISRFV